MARRPGLRSSIRTLAKLSSRHLHWQLGRFRRDVLAILPLANVGLAVTDYLARRFGSDGAAARRVCSVEAARRLGVGPLPGLAPGEMHAWHRWAPLVLILPGLDAWSAHERKELFRIVRAKGGPRESEFSLRFDRFPALRRAVRKLARHRASSGC